MRCLKCNQRTQCTESRTRGRTTYRRRRCTNKECSELGKMYKSEEAWVRVVTDKTKRIQPAPKKKKSVRKRTYRPVWDEPDNEMITDAELEAMIYGGDYE